jgi:16S rRNA processing protein RimM
LTHSPEQKFLEVGYIGQPHGLRGEVVVRLVSTVESRLAPGSNLHCRGARLVVASARPLPGNEGPEGRRWLVRFAGIGTREAAEALRGATLLAEPLAAAEGLWAHEVIGYEVVDSVGHRGKVTALEANPASDLLVLDTGTLVPLRFVTKAQPGRLIVEAPEGLFDL